MTDRLIQDGHDVLIIDNLITGKKENVNIKADFHNLDICDFEKIKMVFSKYKINNQQCLFITDTLGNIKEASHMGVDVIAVTWGFHNEITLAKGNPLAMVKSPDELVGAINNYFGRM